MSEIVCDGPGGHWLKEQSALAVHFSAKKSDWQTPDSILSRLGPIALDPCTSLENPAGADRYCYAPGNHLPLDTEPPAAHLDGLAQDWDALARGGLTYVNPPYGRQIGDWFEHGMNCSPIVYLLPARTDTQWFHLYRKAFDVGCFIRGRLTFKGAVNKKTGKPQSAPFPSMLLGRFHDSGTHTVEWFVKQFGDMGVLID